jgi:hypothetical protein
MKRSIKNSVTWFTQSVLVLALVIGATGCGTSFKGAENKVSDLASSTQLLIDAGPNFANHMALDSGEDVTMKGSVVTTDPSNVAVSYAWIKDTTVLLQGTTADILTATVHFPYGKYDVKLVVVDSEGQVYTDTFFMDLHHH